MNKSTAHHIVIKFLKINEEEKFLEQQKNESILNIGKQRSELGQMSLNLIMQEGFKSCFGF